MQETGNAGTHNYHGLTPSDIFCVLNSIDEPYCIFEVKNERYAIVPTYISSFYEPLMVVIEKEAELINRKNANVNKIVTIYPKSKIDKYLSKIDNKAILYIKNENRTGLRLPPWILYRLKMYLFMGPVFSSPLFYKASRSRGYL